MVFCGIKWENMGFNGRILLFHGGVKTGIRENPASFSCLFGCIGSKLLAPT
jgi:hypothetical protein